MELKTRKLGVAVVASVLTTLTAAQIQAQPPVRIAKPAVVSESNYYKNSTNETSAEIHGDVIILPATPVSNNVVGSGSGCSAEGGCKCGCCDKKKKQKAAKAAAKSHKGLFYDNNFDYLCNPCYDGCLLGDRLKRNCLTDWLSVDVGGQYRMRYHHEDSMRGTPGRVNSFLLHRTRLYLNAEVGQYFRAYIEGLDAVSNYEVLAPRGIDENRMDLQNAFGDLRLLDNEYGTLVARVGRQELLYGAQRSVSPLDWANTRRTFQGYKLMWKYDDLAVDAFWVNPMRRNVVQLDAPNLNQEFWGIYSTYKGVEKQTFDFYWLGFNNFNVFQYDTFGARWQGSHECWMWDTEAAVQTGNTGGVDHREGAWTLGLGRKFECLPWSPTLWVYYDWASGDAVRGNGFHHNFPLAHKYLGFMDFFGRRNIEDFNIQLKMKPCKKVSLLLWWHVFNRQNGNDTPYNVGMASFGTTAGSQYLGHELDLIGKYTITPRANLILGYSRFWSGTYFNANAGIPFAADADFFYTQFQINF